VHSEPDPKKEGICLHHHRRFHRTYARAAPATGVREIAVDRETCSRSSSSFASLAFSAAASRPCPPRFVFQTLRCCLRGQESFPRENAIWSSEWELRFCNRAVLSTHYSVSDSRLRLVLSLGPRRIPSSVLASEMKSCSSGGQRSVEPWASLARA
jgi:hypothetical protein